MPQPRKHALFEFEGHWIAPDHGTDTLYRFSTEPGTGRTSRSSLRTKDLEVAKRLLIEHVLHGAPKSVDDPLSAVLVKYFEERTDKLASRKIARGHGRKVLAFWGETVRVKALTEAKQREFVEHCLGEGNKLAYAARVMATIAAALAHSKLPVPEIIATESKMVTKWQLTSTEPKKAYIPTDAECAKILLSKHMTEKLLRWIIIDAFNAGRPQTAVDLTPAQFNKDAGIVNLLPPGRAQIPKKYRPKVKAGRTFRHVLRAWERKGLDAFGGRYCGYSSLEGVKTALQKVAADTGVPVSTYSVRHKVTSVMRKGKTAEDQVSAVLGHQRANLRTTAGYGEYDPDYQKEAADSMEEWFWRVVKLTRKLRAERLNSQRTPEPARLNEGRAA